MSAYLFKLCQQLRAVEIKALDSNYCKTVS